MASAIAREVCLWLCAVVTRGGAGRVGWVWVGEVCRSRRGCHVRCGSCDAECESDGVWGRE